MAHLTAAIALCLAAVSEGRSRPMLTATLPGASSRTRYAPGKLLPEGGGAASCQRRLREALTLRARGGSSTGGPPSAVRGWTILALATAFELVSSVLLKVGEGFVKPWPSVTGSLLYALSFVSFNLSLRHLEIGIAYAVWSAAVIAALAVIGTVCFGESTSVLKSAGVLFTVVGTVMLAFTDSAL